MRNILTVLVFLLLASCNAVRVNYDYDKDTDYSSYTTYNYYPEMKTGLSQLDTRRLLDAIDSTMQVKGMLLAEEPEFFINITSNSIRAPRNNTVGVGVGGTGRNVGGGLSIGLPIGQPDLDRVIQFDFVDSQKDELFWQAISESSFQENLSPVERETKLKQVVDKVFAKYPPGSKK
ncbi:DUF4136 domain-containing protein [Flavobacteriaceae bacterium KMM 6897]|nr:DUF4136 domain-containing protein [Flavobacteriaceae bacterium KMM 6897]MEB8344988.1 DUF4136 domain-containing protein [Flavobacteriaceae bacterium KMM 6898]